MAKKEFRSYSVTYYSKTFSETKGIGHKKIVVNLKNGTNYVGILNFYQDSFSYIPNDYKHSFSKIPYLNFYEKDFPVIMDVLRNEKPLYIEFLDDSRVPSTNGLGGYGKITTLEEEVGEDDLT